MQRNESARGYEDAVAIVNRDGRILQRHRNGKQKLEWTRSEIVAGWNVIAQRLREEGDYILEERVRSLVTSMACPGTDQRQLVERIRAQRRDRERDPIDRTRREGITSREP